MVVTKDAVDSPVLGQDAPEGDDKGKVDQPQVAGAEGGSWHSDESEDSNVGHHHASQRDNTEKEEGEKEEKSLSKANQKREKKQEEEIGKILTRRRAKPT